jgi:hypothetical protein
MDLPKIGANYVHENGNRYRVLHIANNANISPKYPVSVVYVGPNGNVWVKTLTNFNKKFKAAENLNVH